MDTNFAKIVVLFILGVSSVGNLKACGCVAGSLFYFLHVITLIVLINGWTSTISAKLIKMYLTQCYFFLSKEEQYHKKYSMQL